MHSWNIVWTCDISCDVCFFLLPCTNHLVFLISRPPEVFCLASGFCQKFHICEIFGIFSFFLIPFWGLPNQQIKITVLEECYLNPKDHIGWISVIYIQCPSFTLGKHDGNCTWHQIAQRKDSDQFQKLCWWSFCYVFPFSLCATMRTKHLFGKYYMHLLLFEMFENASLFSEDKSQGFLDWPWTSQLKLCPDNSGFACVYFEIFFQNATGNISCEGWLFKSIEQNLQSCGKIGLKRSEFLTWIVKKIPLMNDSDILCIKFLCIKYFAFSEAKLSCLRKDCVLKISKVSLLELWITSGLIFVP